MKKILLFLITVILFTVASRAQIQTPVSIKKDSSIKKTIIQRAPVTQAPAPKTVAPSVYTLTSAKVNIRTGNDNKETPSNMIFFFREKDGVWGKGTDLFQSGSKSEFKVNSNFEMLLDRVPATAAAAYTLDNLQARGLYFAVYYSPNFITDAWKIESITVTLEFKDQFGNLHPSFGNRVIQYNISNGLLTNANWLLKATADGAFFTPSPVSIGSTF
ncbi:hypothetical protein [Ferruginibacter sp. SUN106]|uniref:hypothetical protein n=1 Tax=Ferruginibacter sp. SUN106 TaxID=2978348 RepID=UPI003D367AE7